MRLKPELFRRKIRGSEILHADMERIVAPTKNQITSASIFKRALSSCLTNHNAASTGINHSNFKSHAPPGPAICNVHRKSFLRFQDGAQNRGYKFVTTVSSPSNEQQQQEESSTSIRTTTHLNSEDTRSPEEIQKELDELISTAYTRAKQISSLVLTRRSSSYDQLPTLTPSTGTSISDTSILDSQLPLHQTDNTTDQSHEIKINDIEVLGIQDEINAVEALLSLTGHANFQKALAQQRERQIQKRNNLTTDSSSEPMDVALSLHSAFISVVSWLCSTLSSLPTADEREHRVNLLSPPPSDSEHYDGANNSLSITGPTKQSILLTNLLHLSDRSAELNLPLTIPQYKTIATMIAKHSSGYETLAILDLSKTVLDLYKNEMTKEEEKEKPSTNSHNTIIQAHFFSEALKELLQRNKLRDIVELFHGMQNIHGIDKVDLQTGMELLNVLKKKVDETLSGSKYAVEFDETDAMELAMILQRPVLDELQSKRRELENYQDEVGETMGALMDKELDENDDDIDDFIADDHDESDHEKSKDEHDSDENDELYKNVSKEEIEALHKMTNMLKTMEKGKDASDLEAKSILAAKAILDKMHNNEHAKSSDDSKGKSDDEDSPPTVSAQFHVNPSSGEVDNVELIVTLNQQPSQFSEEDKKKYDAIYQGLVRDIIYCRDETWLLPDIVPQLEEWNGARGLAFTKEFEAEILEDRTGDDFFSDDPSHDNS